LARTSLSFPKRFINVETKNVSFKEVVRNPEMIEVAAGRRRGSRKKRRNGSRLRATDL